MHLCAANRRRNYTGQSKKRRIDADQLRDLLYTILLVVQYFNKAALQIVVDNHVYYAAKVNQSPVWTKSIARLLKNLFGVLMCYLLQLI